MKTARFARASLFLTAAVTTCAALAQGSTATPPIEGSVGTRPTFPGATGPGINPQGAVTLQGDRAGQSGGQTGQTGQTGQSGQGSPRSPTQRDAAITAAVKSEMAKDPQLAGSAINVQTQSGRVSLVGQAPDAITRDRAGQLASTVRGVTMVDNRLTVGR